MTNELKKKLYKRTILTFIYSFIWMLAISLVITFIQALGVMPRYIEPAYLTPLAVFLAFVITFLKIKKFIKNPSLLEL